ncbi:hypothetical protein A6U87_07550 [Rhizobium sp. AC44/96]|uniref:hypothetical protein n=1 Tax=unclassified Rhizobium TaxID=2613769 RepID=UPI00080FD7D1|nr:MULTISPECIES: hypothetical protein [unclassified Rhizobium]MDM9622981.1 hypothetical protein [Rhizobium sp. S96]OCJ13130.1 hypothetical protein A6U87_07550 [Rhizobium sp. AC44/96]
MYNATAAVESISGGGSCDNCTISANGHRISTQGEGTRREGRRGYLPLLLTGDGLLVTQRAPPNSSIGGGFVAIGAILAPLA